jgi:hypothetical protein
MAEKERSYTTIVNDRKGKYVYRGRGTKEEVLEDLKKLESFGKRKEDLEVVPVLGAERERETKVVYRDRPVYISEEEKCDSGSTGAAAALAATGIGAMVLIGLAALS